jgi:glycosyltransferase involved in cell wall biosynthesis
LEYEFELSIVMPCLNEAETLEVCISKAKQFLNSHKVSGEIIVSDSGSTDGSQEIAQRLGVRIVSPPTLGYGAALLYGIRASKGRYIIMGDSDDSYDFLNLDMFLEKLRAGFELVMGNRFKGGIRPGAMPWKNRWIGNPVLSGIGRILFKSPIGDFHCGLRGFSRKAFDRLQLKSTGMEFASEMVVKAHLLSLKVTEVPTTLSPDGRSRAPHLRPWRDGWRHLRLMFLFSPRWLFLYPGFVLILFSTLLGARIIMGTLNIGFLKLDLNSLIYAGAFLLMGFQAICFAVFTKVFAIQEGLLPQDPKFNKLFDYISLETGLVAGAALLGAGLFGLVHEFLAWKETGFAALDPLVSIRVTFPSAMALVLGIQVIFASFFLSVLGLKLERNE